MRRTSIIDKIPVIRAGSMSTASVAMSSVTADTCFRNDFSAHSFGADSWQNSGSTRSEFYGNGSFADKSSRVDPNNEGNSKVGNGRFSRSLGSRVSLRSGGRQSNRFRTIVGRMIVGASRGAGAAAPLDPGLRVMSVVVEGSNISFCCYNEDQNEIMTETCVATGYETEALVERFLQVARPNLVLVGNPIVNNTRLLDMITRRPPVLLGNEGEKEGGDASSLQQPPIPYRLLKSKDFDFRTCKKIILEKLKVTSMRRKEASGGTEGEGGGRPNYHPDSDRSFPQVFSGGDLTYGPSTFHHLAAVIDFESKVLVKALGALLSYLQSTVFQLTEGKYVIVNRIADAKSSAHMVISPSTFSALHIFSTENHPLIAKGRGNSKEGFSLFSLLDRTRSQGGRQLLREWMLKPLINLEDIRTRQDVIEFFLQPSMETSVGVLLELLPKVGAIDKILLRFQKCTVRPQDFLVLIASASSAISIANVLRHDILSLMDVRADVSTPLAFKFFSELHLQFNMDSLINLRERISSIVDSEPMIENKGACVAIRYGVDKQLDFWTEQYESIEEILAEVADDIYQKHGHLDGLTVVFMPQVGYLVKLDKLIDYAQATLPPDFERIFVQDNDIYLKCDETKKLDEEIGDLDGLIKDRKRHIVNELEEYVLESENELRDSFNALSTLDCILSFANCAVDLAFTRPHLIDGEDYSTTQSQSHHRQEEDSRQVISIKDGRHPLQELICEREFVENDVQMDDQNRILCVTGPNYSGKSCYMRQVGLLVYMAHLGSFIPCSEATISITDQIFARVSTIETCSRPQSSYQLELTEMASILLKATPKSLVLIDEFGKGTNPASGIAVLGAALKKLSKIKCKTVCTTHFLELFTMNVIRDGMDGIRARRMTIHLPEGNEDGATSLFRLEDGVASSSAGLVCAKNAGVGNAVIARAKEIIETLRARKPIRPLPEATKQAPTLSESEKEILAHFVSVDSWESSNHGDAMKLKQFVSNESQKRS